MDISDNFSAEKRKKEKRKKDKYNKIYAKVDYTDICCQNYNLE